MRKAIVAFIVALIAALALVVAAPANAIVHPVTPIGCFAHPAVVASGFAAGGTAAIPAVSTNPSPGPLFPAQGRANSRVWC